MRFPLSALLLATLPLATAPGTVSGQSSRITGVSVERFHQRGGGRFVAVNYRRTDLGRDNAGLDLGVGLVPTVLAGGMALVQLDFGLARGLRVGPGTLLLKGGAGSFVALGSQNMLFPGVQAGAAALIPLERQSGLRVDLTHHVYLSDGRTIRMWSVAVGLAVLPRRAQPLGRTSSRNGE